MPRRPDDVDPAASPWHLLGSELRHWREDVCHLSQQAAAAQALCDRGDLSRWERGLAPVHQDVMARLDGIYGAQGRLEALRAFAVEFDQLRQRVPEESASDLAEDGDMHRRAAMQLLAALGAGAVIPPGTLETLFSGIDEASRGLNADDWEEIVWEHGLSYYTQAPGTILNAVTADLAEVSQLLHRTSSPPARAGLLRVSAQLAVVLGMEMSDVGEQRAALQSWRMARRAADATGDRSLRVWVRGYEAKYGFWSSRPAPVLARLAADAVRISGGKTDVGLAMAYRAEAFISAGQGDAATTRATLNKLADVCEKLPDSDEASPLWSFGERAAAWARAYSSALIGDTGQASAAVDDAIALCPETFTADITHYELVRALALANDDPSGGLAHAVTAAQAWPISTMRRFTIDRILGALPEGARTLESARELRALTAG